MFMTFAAVVVALALGHVAQGLAESVRRHGWFDDWLRWLGARMPADVAWHGRCGDPTSSTGRAQRSSHCS